MSDFPALKTALLIAIAAYEACPDEKWDEHKAVVDAANNEARTKTFNHRPNGNYILD